jgi:hypothetical protein
MDILLLYNASQTYTNTVYEHLFSFSRYSTNRFWYAHHDENQNLGIDLHRFEAVVLHYSVRLPFDQISNSAAEILAQYSGLKVLFIQDEYNNTHRSWNWISRIGFDLVFTVVPQQNISEVYPPARFPNTKFVGNLTGYVPENIVYGGSISWPSERSLIVGYRGRDLPLEYGKLGKEKVEIGMLVRSYCKAKSLRCDIEWTEAARIYGSNWYDFVVSCRSMLGSESGSNVFDWDGSLAEKIQAFRNRNPRASDDLIYRNLIEPHEVAGFMNQISPRAFEAIALKTVLVLFEGEYSGVLKADIHYLSMKKDGSNLGDIFARLNDPEYVDRMAKQAYSDIIESGKYSYESFIGMVDYEFEIAANHKHGKLKVVTSTGSHSCDNAPSPITTYPIRMVPPKLYGWRDLPLLFAEFVWCRLPDSWRLYLKPKMQRLINIGGKI